MAAATTPLDTPPAPQVILLSSAACEAGVTHGDQLQDAATPFTGIHGLIESDPVMEIMVAATPPSATLPVSSMTPSPDGAHNNH